MVKKRLTAVILLLAFLIAAAMTGCGAKQEYDVNLLQNPGFEDGDEAWTVDAYSSADDFAEYKAIQAENAPEGTGIFKLESNMENDVRLVQEVEVDGNSYYELSCMIKTSDVDGGEGLSGASVGLKQSFCVSEFVTGNSDWTRITVYGKTDSSTKTVLVALRLGYYSAECSGTAYFDDVCFKKLKELPEGAEAIDMAQFEFINSSDITKETEKNSIEVGVILRGLLYFTLIAAAGLILIKKCGKFPKSVMFICFGLALVLRLIASVQYTGFKVDINCFSAWGKRMASVGPFEFYSESYFCDYPPLYMLVTGLLALIRGSGSLTEGAGLMLLKLPACLCDIYSAYIIYKIGKSFFGERIGAIAGVIYAFMPTAILNSAVWGQVDSVLVLFLLLTFYLMESGKFGFGVFAYFVGLMFKPQALLFAPVMALAAAGEFISIGIDSPRKRASRLLKGFGGLLGGVALFAVASVTMANGQKITWLFEKYADTLGSYNYATLSSFGFMGLLGGQWVSATEASPLGISYSLLGTLLTALCVVAGVALYCCEVFNLKALFNKRNGNFLDKSRFKSEHTRALWLASAVILAGVVTFAARTHERYMFPVTALLIVCAIRFNSLRFAWLSMFYGLINFINTAVVLYVYEDTGLYMSAGEPVMRIGSGVVVLLYVLTVLEAFRTVCGKREKRMVENKKSMNATHGSRQNERLEALIARRKFTLPKITWKDIVVCLLITAVYACFAFSDLGDAYAPETQWITQRAEVYAVADLGEIKTIDSMLYSADANSSFTVSYSEAGEIFTEYGTYGANHEGLWQECTGEPFSARYIKISAKSAITINELALFSGGERIFPENVEASVTPIDTVNAKGEYLFDYTGDITQTVLQSVPQTSLKDGGMYLVSFASPIDIYEIEGYVTYGEPESTFDFYIESNGEWVLGAQLLGEYTDCWSSINYCVPASDMTGISRIVLDGGDGAVRLGELAITDENGLAVIDGVTEIASLAEVSSGEKTNALDCLFDEAELYTAQKESEAQLGESKAWRITSCSDYVIADFGETKRIDRGTYYTSICSGSFTVYYSYDGINWSTGESHTHEVGDMYYWRGLPETGSHYKDLTARYVAICAESNKLRFLEFGFFEEASSTTPLPVTVVYSSQTGENGGGNIFDEQSLVPERPSYMNSMYFDEIYHARTAYEGLNGMSIYEWTHPPLGKDIMSLGIIMFGMNPFGWRFMGALAGVLMIPGMFFIGLLMFRKRSWAAMLASLMALDGMHYVQTRIATIDSYSVMWIIFMFLFMYWYFSISFYDKRLSKTFIPLGLCGLCFGLGAASKWICLYAGAGLAVIFFVTLFRRFAEYKTARTALENGEERNKEYLEKIRDSFVPNTLKTVLFCMVAFVIIPLIIYCASYYPYFNAEGETRAWYKIILDNQTAMFNYHSTLEATHPFQSDWYTWPVIYRPILFYTGKYMATGKMECISSFGNPVIWYMGLACSVAGIVIFIKRLCGGTVIESAADKGFLRHFNAGDEALSDKKQRDTWLLFFLVVGVVCNLAPWIGISRCIFIYHYFATVPFIMMFTVYIFRNICRKHKKLGIGLLAFFIVFAIVLFFMFLPVWTGMETSKEYVNTYLKWFESWIF